jgi:hypothetical protein
MLETLLVKTEYPVHLEKNFYISELHMGGSDLDFKLMDHTDHAGPYKTLETAKKMYKRLISNNKMFNNWDFMIRGPEHQKSGYKSIWYAPEDRPESQ